MVGPARDIFALKIAYRYRDFWGNSLTVRGRGRDRFAAHGSRMGDRSVTSIPVDKFRSGVDHFDTWIKYFEDAIDITHPGVEAATRETLYRKWLPLKLDDKARLTHAGVTGPSWAEFKTNFKEALKDPQEEYNWHARKVTIVWDGVESFQSLETRIKRAVDMYSTEDKANKYWAVLWVIKVKINPMSAILAIPCLEIAPGEI